jgi:hypothetical protein
MYEIIAKMSSFEVGYALKVKKKLRIRPPCRRPIPSGPRACSEKQIPPYHKQLPNIL